MKLLTHHTVPIQKKRLAGGRPEKQQGTHIQFLGVWLKFGSLAPHGPPSITENDRK